MRKTATGCAVVLTMLMIATGCGGNDDDAAGSGEDAFPAVVGETSDDSDASDGPADASGDDGQIEFGQLIEGSFLLSGAEEEQFDVNDDELDFRGSGGCQGGAFGFGVNVTDAAQQTTYATFGAQGPRDLSGGATGEFEDTDLEVGVFSDDMSAVESYKGPVKMVISEHNTGGADGNFDERRMTVTLLGTIPSDNGDLDVDVTYRWLMGCP